MVRRQGIFWLLTIPENDYQLPTELVPELQWIKGQLEQGEGGFRHWQICAGFKKKTSLVGVKSLFGRSVHAELSRSAAANEYVWKEQSRIGAQFTFGTQPFQRNEKKDWEAVWRAAQSGDLESIPADVRVVSYRTLRAIASDYDRPEGIVRTCHVFWGPTATGKSRRAWDEAGLEAYSKDPRTKFWCGYQGQENVVIDEFRGGIDIAHMLRWLDRYPVRIEIKGSSRPLVGKTIWITSNLNPAYWYPEADDSTRDALLRRLCIVDFTPINDAAF